MYRVAHFFSGSRILFAATLSALLTAAAISPQLAIVYSPLLFLIALYSFDEQLYDSLVELVAGLGQKAPRAPLRTASRHAHRATFAADRHVDPARSPRAPPAFA